jgi:hypothetical protein
MYITIRAILVMYYIIYIYYYFFVLLKCNNIKINYNYVNNKLKNKNYILIYYYLIHHM